MRIAIVHDQLTEFGGSERVLVALKKMFPQADVFTSVCNLKKMGSHESLFQGWKIYTSWFDKIPFIRNYYSPFRFLTPKIWESFNFSGYDLVISSSGSWMSKGVITKKPTLHICYLHHPPRYLYGYETAIEWQKYWPIKVYGTLVNHFLRMWDFESSKRPDFFIANSQETRSRIKKFYRRDAAVIYPPVNIPKDQGNQVTSQQGNSYFLTVSRLAKAKHIDVLIKAANKLKFNLKIVGTGRDEKYLKSIAGPTVEFLGNIPDSQLEKIYSGAKAFLFASRDEEFGIAVVEAMGRSLPIIAYKSGGVPEYVKDDLNGYLFDELDEDCLAEQINKLTSLSKEKYLEMRKEARATAEKFSEANFREKIINFISLHS